MSFTMYRTWTLATVIPQNVSRRSQAAVVGVVIGVMMRDEGMSACHPFVQEFMASRVELCRLSSNPRRRQFFEAAGVVHRRVAHFQQRLCRKCGPTSRGAVHNDSPVLLQRRIVIRGRRV